MSGILGEYTEIFLEESEDQIEELNSNLLLLEQDHSNHEIINDIFRAAHSLKSSAAFVGLYNLSDLAHKMENLLQKIREGSLGINTVLVTLLFECFDLIKSVIDAVADGEKVDTSYDDMIAKLADYEKQHMGGATTAQPTTTSEPKVEEPQSEKPVKVDNPPAATEAPAATPTPAPTPTQGDEVHKMSLSDDDILEIREECQIREAKAYDINVSLRKDTQMKGLRFALILQNIKEKGVVFGSEPEESELETVGGEIPFLAFILITQMDEYEIKKEISVDMVETVLVSHRDVGESKTLTDNDIRPLTTDNEENAELEEEVKTKKAPAYDVFVSLKADTPMKGLRFTLILQNLKNHATVFKSDPPMEQLETGTDRNTLTFIIVTPLQPNEVKKEILVDMVDVILVKQRKIPKTNGIAARSSTKSSTKTTGSDVKTTESPASGYGSRRAKKKANEEKQAASSSTGKITLKSIKVSSEKLDQLMNNVGELVITNSGFQKIYDDMIRKFGDDVIFAELKSKIDQINRISKDLQSGIMNTRMVPIGSVFSRFSRLVRDLSIETNKKVKLNLLGENTELDKKVVDMIGEPLLHLIRNSIDHGIEDPQDRAKVGKPEYGTVELNAYQGGNNIMVEIRDDGKGLSKDGILNKAIERGLVTSGEASNLSDNDIYQFIFAPGFSTSQEVTDISGRGVGMNVVNKLIQDFKGKILINTQEGIGTSFTLCFPQALAIIPSILVSMEEEIYAFPLSEVFETIRVQKDQINTLEGHEIINLRGEVLPIYRLNRILNLATNENVEEFPVVIVNFNSRKLGFIVDDLIGKHETVIKTLEKNFRNVSGITGASLMGDGTIIVVLDITGLIEIASNAEIIKKSLQLTGEEMNRINISRSIDLTESNKIFKTLNSTNIYNTKLVEIQEATKSKRKKEKQRRLKQIQENQKQIRKESEPPQPKQITEPKVDVLAETKQIPPVEEPPPVLAQTESIEQPPVTTEVETTKPIAEQPAAQQEEEVDLSTLSDEEINQKIRENIAEQMKERTDSIVSERKEIGDLLKKDQIRKLESVVNTGMMNAGLVLSQLVGSNVELYMPEITLTDKDLLTEELRYTDEALVGLKIRMNGEMNGNLLMIISEERGIQLASVLLKESESDLAKKISDDSLSVLMEISNIVCASVINALSNKSKSQIMPSVPELYNGTLREVLDSVKPEKTKFLSMNTEFIYDGGNLIGNLIFLPDFDELIALIEKLP